MEQDVDAERRKLFSVAAAAAGLFALGASKSEAAGVRRGEHSREQPVHNLTGALGDVQTHTTPAQPAAVPSAGGATPIARDTESWDKIVNDLKNQYQIKTDLAETISQQFLAIDHGFSLTEMDLKELKPFFRYLHVEPLLDQAADLLDRAIRDRADWDEKAVRAFNLGLEMTEYAELDKIHQAEIEAGYYSLPYNQSAPETRAQEAVSVGYSIAANYLEWLITQSYNNDKMNEQSGFEQLQAWISALPERSKDSQGDLLQHVWNGVAKNKESHLQASAQSLSFFRLYNELSSLHSQHEAMLANARASASRQQSAKVKESWDRRDIDFRRGRTEVSRNLADLKVKAATSPGGTLNFPDRMQPIRRRFQRDFRDAVARMSAARAGLELLYGYTEDLPSPSSGQYFDDCQLWVREAISFIVRFSQLEQNYVFPLSIRGLMSQQEWQAGFNACRWQFQIPESLFPDQRHVRLRGLGAFVVYEGRHSNQDVGVWQATISPPQESYCQHLGGDLSRLDQSEVPPCRLGRVGTRESIRDSDIVGVSAIHNASPFGYWHIDLSRQSTGNFSTSDLKNIMLDLHLAIRSTPNDKPKAPPLDLPGIQKQPVGQVRR